MIEPFVSFLLARIGTVMDDEIRSLRGVREKISGARTELILVHAFLRDADSQVSCGGGGRNCQVSACVVEIREAAWELEDLLFDRPSSSWVKEILESWDAAPRIDSITQRLARCHSVLEKICVPRDSLWEPGQVYLIPRQTELRRSLSHRQMGAGVGTGVVLNAALNDGVEILAKELTRTGGGGPRVLSICGMGGIGKTTLARQVYHDPRVRSHFKRFAWVQISPEFQQNQVWEAILTSLFRPRFSENTIGVSVARMLCQTLAEERCLVVLDDVWSASTWDRLKHAFPGEDSPSRILLTSRNKEVNSGFLHEPRYLTDDESWDFLTAKANFENIIANLGDLDRAEMKNLGETMLQFCGGLPLAIEVLAGILSRKHSVESWKVVQRHVKAYINRGGIGELQDPYSGVLWLLSLSYEELPYQLKQCFLHLAHFSEDGIRMKELYQMWMAEEMVSSEDEACEYFEKLENRYMVRVAERSSTGGVKNYAIHGLVRDMCFTKAREENFLRISDFTNRHRAAVDFSPAESTSRRSRRLAVYLDENTQNELVRLIASETGECVRSFVCFNTTENPYLEPVMKPLLCRFSRLRVLKFENQSLGEIGKLPREIGELVHLRFLSLRGSNVTKLPSSIGKLSRLQTLDLRTDWKVVIPKTMSKLTQLRHLYFPRKIEVRGGTLNLENLRNLRTLVNISTEHCDTDVLSNLPELRKLKMSAWRNDDVVRVSTLQSFSLSVNDDKIVDITPLVLSCSPSIAKLCIESKMEELPEPLLSCSNLQKLILRRTNLDVDPMRMLEGLPRLTILRLEENAFVGIRMEVSSTGFRVLESLFIGGLKYFSELGLECEAFPRLRCLHVMDCPSFRTTRAEIQRFINPDELFL